MESIIEAQQELCGRIARTLDNVKKAGSARITSAFLATNLKLLDNKWAKFEEQHDWLRRKHGEELKGHDYHLTNFLNQAEEIYTY